MTRGIKKEVDDFIRQLQGKWYEHKWLPTGWKGSEEERAIEEKRHVQVQVRPIQLWEIVYPESSRDLMLTTILGRKQQNVTQHKKHNKWIWALRKMLGIKPVGEYNGDFQSPIVKEHIEVIGVGEKEDYYVDGYEQL